MIRWLTVLGLFVFLGWTTSPAFAAPRTDTIYVVQTGDNLSKIAAKFGVPFNALLKANGLTLETAGKLRVGQSLVIPGVSAPPGSAPAAGGGGVCPATYTIQSGDKLVKVAEKCGVTFNALLKANNLSLADASKIRIGQVINIPGGGPATPASSAPPSSVVVSGQHGVSGELSLCEVKPSYADTIERICVNELIRNHTGATIEYGIIGVKAQNLSGGPSVFHTSWLGSLAINANCTGPRDRCGGAWEDGLYIATPGTYRLTLDICYSSVRTCQDGGDWETLTPGIVINVVYWRP